MMKFASFLSMSTVTTASVLKLATFDGAKDTTFSWKETNDPVMGGQSVGTFSVDTKNKVGIFNGTCKIVPSLKAPGFCNAQSQNKWFSYLPNASSYFDNGSFQLRAKTTTPDFAGFRVAFAAKDVPHSGPYGGGSFKSGFNMTGTDWQVVEIPFDSFSWDWSGYTGRCDTLDPDGRQHHCCSDGAKYCPTAEYLGTIKHLEIWAEGAEGDYHLEVDWIGVGDKETVCKDTEYCCPDAKHCLTPHKTSCAKDTECASGDVCCPLTKVCVTPGAECVAPPVCKNTEFCCPDAKHCLTPVNPGVFCTGPGTQGSCDADQVCCPLLNECVKVGAACVAP